MLAVIAAVAGGVGALITCSRRADRVSGFDGDLRYAAVHAFDPAAFRAMRAKAEACMDRGPTCLPARKAELEDELSKILGRAFHEAPDGAVIAYVEAKRQAIEALAPIDPEACVAALETGPGMSRALASPMWDRLPRVVRDAAERAQATLIAGARAPGTRSPAFTAVEAYASDDRYRQIREDDRALNPNAPFAERCWGDLQVYAAILKTQDPARARILRFLLEDTASRDIHDHPDQ